MKINTKEIALGGTLIALLIMTLALKINIGGSQVPITLQTLFILLFGLLLKPHLSFIIVFTYVLMGAIGIPVYSGYEGGISILLGPKGGFLLSFIIVAPLISTLKELFGNEIIKNIIYCTIGTIIIYIIG